MNKDDPETLELFTPRQFDSSEAQKRFALNRIEAAAEYLEAQGIPPLFIAAALFDQHKRYNGKGLRQLSEEEGN